MTVIQIGALGYGTQDSPISYTKQLISGELTEEIADYATKLILSGECLKPVDNSDDGCIDGRPTDTVSFIDETGQLVAKPSLGDQSHDRAKVAGGGYITALAMQLAVAVQAADVDDELDDVIARLSDAQIYCGIHTGGADHSASACGANDKLQTILANAVLYKQEIGASTEALITAAGLTFESTIYDQVISAWQTILQNKDYFAESTSTSRIEVITSALKEAQRETEATEPLAVAKNLTGDHKEDFIVINYVNHTTFSQAHFAAALARQFPTILPKNRAQTFVVDVWRLVTLANAVSGQEGAGDRRLVALYAGIIYQLATAATLTDGTLPVFIVQE